MKTLRFTALAFAMALLARPGMGAAQEELDPAAEPRGAERTARQAIAQYPPEVRDAVCVVAGHPELLVKLARIQHQSSGDFADLLDPYNRRDQEAFWDLARFPGLVEKLADADAADEAQLGEVLAEYPPEVSATARRLARREHQELAEIAQLHRRAEARFDNLLSLYPPQVQDQARLLLQYPELLSQLDTDLDQVVLLGDAYRQDPEQVRQQLAQEHLDRPERMSYGRPAASRTRASSASRPRAARYDYDLNNLEGPADDDAQVEVVYHRSYYEYPYPYWFGYPRWYGPAGWYAGFNWYLTPHLSATIGLEVPVIRRAVPVYRPYVRSRGESGWDRDSGRGHAKRRSHRH